MADNEKSRPLPDNLVEDMSALRVEMDTAGDDQLPTYAELQQQAPPNSRFGRWREWVDKRASERHVDQTPEERRARQERLGWGESIVASPTDVSGQQSQIPEVLPGPASSAAPQIQLPPSYPEPPRLGESLPPTHAALYSFGSRFFSHSSVHICCLLPVVRDRFLLMGTVEGLSVLDVLPRLHGEEPLGMSNGLDGAKSRELWTGCGVIQCALLEDASISAGFDQGIVLALVATMHMDGTGRSESVRHLRMYKLSSLVSLVKWTVTQKDSPPVHLGKSVSWDSTPARKQRNRLSKMINLLTEVPVDHSAIRAPSPQPASRPQSLRGQSRKQPTPEPSNSWDMVDDLPLQWATDFEPFQHAKLANTTILFFELWKSNENGNYGRTMLAIGTSKSIVLFEAPRGERAFTFVKDYYTPHPAKSARFIYQAVPDSNRLVLQQHTLASRSRESLVSPPGSPSSGHARRVSAPGQSASPQLSLFITFEKKAVVVRLSDAAVGEVDFLQDPPNSPDHSPTHMGSHGSRLQKRNSDAVREGRSLWAPLVQVYLPRTLASAPPTASMSPARLYYLITRGNSTYFYPSPLSIPLNLSSAHYVHVWTAPPHQVAARIITDAECTPILQLIAFGDGAEIEEISIADITRGTGRGNGKARSETGEPRRAFAHEGCLAGYLCSGGEWDKLAATGNAWRTSYIRPPAMSRSMSDESLDERSTVSDAGVYGWVQKDVEDFRVFWLGSCDATDV